MRRLTHSVIFLAFFASFAPGCTPIEKGNAPAEKGKSTKKRGDPPAETFPGDTTELRIRDQIAWNKRAIELLPRVKDEESATALVEDLRSLIKERIRQNERARVFQLTNKFQPLPKAEKDIIEVKYGEDLRTSTLRYINVVSPFENIGKKHKLNVFLKTTYGLDVSRMKFDRP